MVALGPPIHTRKPLPLKMLVTKCRFEATILNFVQPQALLFIVHVLDNAIYTAIL